MLTDWTSAQIIDYLRNELKPKRYIHTLGVAYTAASMAMCHGVDIDKAFLAGLLHDCAKQYSGQDLLKGCKTNQIEIRPVEETNPQLLHGKYGAWLAENYFHVTDREVLDAIIWHTTGKPEMNPLEQILYIADYIEPARNELAAMARIRKLAFEDLDKATYVEAESILQYIKDKGKELDTYTLDTCEYYRQKIKENEV